MPSQEEFDKRWDDLIDKHARVIRDSNATYYSDLEGNLYSRQEDFYKKLAEGKTMTAYNKGGVVGRFSDYSPVHREFKGNNIMTNTDSVDKIKQNLQRLQKMLDGATKWYIRSSPEYRNLRNSLNEMLKSDKLSNPEYLKSAMEKTAKAADAYLLAKEQDGVKISKNTEARISAAYEVAMTMHFSASYIETKEKSVDSRESEKNGVEKDDVEWGGKVSTAKQEEPSLEDDDLEFIVHGKDGKEKRISADEASKIAMAKVTKEDPKTKKAEPKRETKKYAPKAEKKAEPKTTEKKAKAKNAPKVEQPTPAKQEAVDLDDDIEFVKQEKDQEFSMRLGKDVSDEPVEDDDIEFVRPGKESVKSL